MRAAVTSGRLEGTGMATTSPPAGKSGPRDSRVQLTFCPSLRRLSAPGITSGSAQTPPSSLFCSRLDASERRPVRCNAGAERVVETHGVVVRTERATSRSRRKLPKMLIELSAGEYLAMLRRRKTHGSGVRVISRRTDFCAVVVAHPAVDGCDKQASALCNVVVSQLTVRGRGLPLDQCCGDIAWRSAAAREAQPFSARHDAIPGPAPPEMLLSRDVLRHLVGSFYVVEPRWNVWL